MKIRTLLLAAMLSAVIMAAAGGARAANAFEADGMANILAAKAGRPFVMLVWSLDCVYCHASIKNLAAQRGDLDIVTIAIEPAVDQQSSDAIAAATAALGPDASHWAFGDAPAEQLRYQLDPKWRGELPRSYWYDAQGRRTAAVSGLLTPAIIAEKTTAIGAPR